MKDLLGKIPNNVFILFEDSFGPTNPTRYCRSVNIEKLKIRLLDEHGVVNLNNVDFTLTFELDFKRTL